MERFLILLKAKLLGQQSKEEAEELDIFLQANKDYYPIFEAIFSGKTEEQEANLHKAEQAYAVHFTKMQLANQLKD